MKTEWTEELIGYQPKQFEKLNEDTYIQRKNIRRDILRDDLTGSEQGWICESRLISEDVYNDFVEAMDSPAQQQVIENQQINDTNVMIIMCAIADLYEKI